MQGINKVKWGKRMNSFQQLWAVLLWYFSWSGPGGCSRHLLISWCWVGNFCHQSRSLGFYLCSMAVATEWCSTTKQYLIQLAKWSRFKCHKQIHNHKHDFLVFYNTQRYYQLFLTDYPKSVPVSCLCSWDTYFTSVRNFNKCRNLAICACCLTISADTIISRKLSFSLVTPMDLDRSIQSAVFSIKAHLAVSHRWRRWHRPSGLIYFSHL